MIAPVIAKSQSFTLPTSILDSMLWEVERGRSCDSLRLAQAKLINSQGKQLLSTEKELKLSQAKSVLQDSLLANEQNQRKLDQRQSDLDKKVLKGKVKRRNKFIAIESIGIILLLLL